MCWLHTTITPTHLWWLLARLLLGLGTRGYANQVPFYDQTTILIFFDNARRFFTVNPLGPFDRWLKQFTSMNRMEIFWLLSRRSSSFAASAGCFHLWWYPTLLGAHQVPQKRTCVSLLPPQLCCWHGRNDQSNPSNRSVTVDWGHGACQKPKRKKSLFFSSSLAYWPSSSFSVPLLLVPVSSLHVTRQNTFAEQAKHPIPPRQEATVKFNRVHLKEEEIEKNERKKRQIELNQTDEKIWKFSNQIRTNFFLLFKNFLYFSKR